MNGVQRASSPTRPETVPRPHLQGPAIRPSQQVLRQQPAAAVRAERGSGLFVIYSDDCDVTGGLRPDRGWGLHNRGFVVKFNRLFRF